MALHSRAARTQASARTRTQRSPLRTWLPTTASPNRVVRSSSSACWRSSVAVVAEAPPAPESADNDRLSSPALGHVLVLDALLQQDDALQQRLRPGRAAGDVDVDRDDLVDPLGDGVRVPVGTA